jgi:hypothetical protein
MSTVDQAREELAALLRKLDAGESVTVKAIAEVVERADLGDGLPPQSPKAEYVDAVRRELAERIAPDTLDAPAPGPVSPPADHGSNGHGSQPGAASRDAGGDTALGARVDKLEAAIVELGSTLHGVAALIRGAAGHDKPVAVGSVIREAAAPSSTAPPAPAPDERGPIFTPGGVVGGPAPARIDTSAADVERTHAPATTVAALPQGGPPLGALSAAQRAALPATTFGTAANPPQVMHEARTAAPATPAARAATIATPAGAQAQPVAGHTGAATVIDATATAVPAQQPPAAKTPGEALAADLGRLVEGARPLAARAARELPADHPGRDRFLAFYGDFAREAANVAEALAAPPPQA